MVFFLSKEKVFFVVVFSQFFAYDFLKWHLYGKKKKYIVPLTVTFFSKEKIILIWKVPTIQGRVMIRIQILYSRL